MRSLWAVICLLGALLVSAQDDGGDLSSLIKEVFTSAPPKGNEPAPVNEPDQGSLNENYKETDPNLGSPLGGTGLGGSDCTCVPWYLCANGTVITDGAGLLDIRSGRGNVCYHPSNNNKYVKCQCWTKGEFCDSYNDVCCKEPLDENHRIEPVKKGRRGCGFRNNDGVGFRITGADENEAQFGEFPWMIAVLKTEAIQDGGELKVYQCGGALIHEQVVMTAAHCVQGKDAALLRVRAGEWDTQTKNELFPHQDRDVAQVIIHEKYYAGALYNDIALLILKDPFNFTDNVDIVCLPKQSDIVINEECYASGWGKDVFGKEITQMSTPAPNPILTVIDGVRENVHNKINKFHVLFGKKPDEHSTLKPLNSVIQQKIDKFKNLFGSKSNVQQVSEAPLTPVNLDERMGDEPNTENHFKFPGKSGQYQVILKKIDLPIVERNRCQDALRKTRLGPHFRLHESFVCAGGIKGRDTCKGDGGSPLVCPIPGEKLKYQQVGIVAWGIGCGNETPAVYANVAQFRDWIDQHFRRFNFVPEYVY